MAHESVKPLEVAIVGGGIIGLALAIGLQRRGISFTIYERSAALGELSFGLGMTINAERAMELLDTRVHQIWQAVTVPSENAWFYYADGFNEPDGDAQHTEQDTLYTVRSGDYSLGLRSDFLADMERLVPKDVIKLAKELVSIQNTSNKGVVLEFNDGSTAEADVVVGCDGIRSRVRHAMFGPGPRAQYSHKFAFRGLVPMAKARAALGSKAERSICHCGPNGLLITYPVGRGSMANSNVVAFAYDAAEWTGTKNGREGSEETSHNESDIQRYTQPTTRSEAMQIFGHFGPTVRTFVSLLPERLDKWAIFDMLDSPVPSFALGPLCLAGDAAHASSPHHGAGAGMGIEDALVLAELLANVAGRPAWSSTMVTEALEVYSGARYERAMWLVQSSRHMGELYQWRDPECGSDSQKLQAEYLPRQSRLCDYDVGAMVRDALATLEQRLTT